jgi:hypothetical protein
MVGGHAPLSTRDITLRAILCLSFASVNPLARADGLPDRALVLPLID